MLISALCWTNYIMATCVNDFQIIANISAISCFLLSDTTYQLLAKISYNASFVGWSVEFCPL